MTRLMRELPELEVVSTVETAEEALALDLSHVDAVILEMNLGPWSISGFDVAMEIRRSVNVGIILFTRHAVPDLNENVPSSRNKGWSVVHKGPDIDPARFAEIVRSTARGLNIIDPAFLRGRPGHQVSVLDRLTVRQRQILSLLATGLDAKAIAAHLGLAAVTVRQDLSRIYSALVPDSGPGVDLRTRAVIRYLREVHDSAPPDRDPVALTAAM